MQQQARNVACWRCHKSTKHLQCFYMPHQSSGSSYVTCRPAQHPGASSCSAPQLQGKVVGQMRG